jgi:hypothetical protein
MPESKDRSPSQDKSMWERLLDLKEGEQAGLVFLNKKKPQVPAKPSEEQQPPKK